MNTFWFWFMILGDVFWFALGYYVSGHPDDTRTFLSRVKERSIRAVEKLRS